MPTEIIEKIAEVLGVSVADIMSDTPIVINNQSLNQGTQIGHVEYFYTDQKELLEKIIASKDDEIRNLKEVINSLKDVINSLTAK